MKMNPILIIDLNRRIIARLLDITLVLRFRLRLRTSRIARLIYAACDISCWLRAEGNDISNYYYLAGRSVGNNILFEGVNAL